MHADFWHERWQQNQIGFHQNAINVHLQTFWPTLAVPAASRIFVPLCGKSADMLWLRSQGYTVLGVEISPLAVEAFFSENGLPVSVRTDRNFSVYEADGICIYCGDFFELTQRDLAGVVAVFDRASLVALPPEMRPGYATHMQAILGPATTVLLVSFDYPQHEMQGPPFSVQEPEVRSLYGQGCDVSLLHTMDILPQEPRFRDKGVTRMEEKVYRLTTQSREMSPCAS